MDMPELSDPKTGQPLPVEWAQPKCLLKLTKLGELLANPCWSNGPAKGERALMVFAKETGFSAIVKVESPPLSLSAGADTFDEALGALELALRLDRVPWKRDANPLGQAKKKKK